MRAWAWIAKMVARLVWQWINTCLSQETQKIKEEASDRDPSVGDTIELGVAQVCGIPLPDGLRNSDRLAEPLFTPSSLTARSAAPHSSRSLRLPAIKPQVTLDRTCRCWSSASVDR